jgi:sugar phosphate isomerase/epimerase
MITNTLFRKSVALLVFTLFLGALFSRVSVSAADKTIVLKKYPTLKFGFTSQNLAKWLPNSVDNLKKVIDFAKKSGFSFIELRDTNAGLSCDDCKKIAAYAKEKKIEVIYAMGHGGMDSNFLEIFSKGMANTMLFSGPKFARAAAYGKAFFDDKTKKYWNAEEFATLVQNINQAGNTAKLFGYTMSVENTFEGVKGDGSTTFGIADLFGPNGVNSNVALQVDTGNFFCVSRENNSPSDVRAFMEAVGKKVLYSHLKTSVDRKTGKILNGNDVPFDFFFDLYAKYGNVYVTLELANGDTLENTKTNHQKSVDYLIKNF